MDENTLDKENCPPGSRPMHGKSPMGPKADASSRRPALQALPPQPTAQSPASARPSGTTSSGKSKKRTVDGNAKPDVKLEPLVVPIAAHAVMDYPRAPPKKFKTTDAWKEQSYVSIFDMQFVDHDECMATLNSFLIANGVGATAVGKQYVAEVHVGTTFQCCTRQAAFLVGHGGMASTHCPWTIEMKVNTTSQRWRIVRSLSQHNHHVPSPNAPPTYSFYSSMPRGPWANPLVAETEIDDWCRLRGFAVVFNPAASTGTSYMLSCQCNCPWFVFLHHSANDEQWRLYPGNLVHNHAVAVPLGPYLSKAECLGAVLQWCAAQNVLVATSRLFQDVKGRSVLAVVCTKDAMCPFHIRIVPASPSGWRIHIASDSHEHVGDHNESM
ncbi:hypothetical protein SPRG_00853 [Saprolegnia parasitica CBS 223.65]|uniref:Uncharacterized protein n=1 Tax=Saprolegnia parasitica (strain CBS 223.65) TaxID=695850 RepID=A0A067D716_SAPPC|nr:hypothetical protein SPRG_00853 [Saprolegnia parasitica CBS 223.65]KDO34792.1 hypothetical protein SPRG_00853 [Saprolegnia parasitica CBS 223.65]|eukprot:XP_012194459.1 hypothetical protein SPRG_00853 [Saprolegnia parasitica CBS 223.65]